MPSSVDFHLNTHATGVAAYEDIHNPKWEMNIKLLTVVGDNNSGPEVYNWNDRDPPEQNRFRVGPGSYRVVGEYKQAPHDAGRLPWVPMDVVKIADDIHKVVVRCSYAIPVAVGVGGGGTAILTLLKD